MEPMPLSMGMNEADLEVLRGMKIEPHADENEVEKAMFAEGDLAVDGNFTGVNVSLSRSFVSDAWAERMLTEHLTEVAY